jgi:hypothetical protein
LAPATIPPTKRKKRAEACQAVRASRFSFGLCNMSGRDRPCYPTTAQCHALGFTLIAGRQPVCRHLYVETYIGGTKRGAYRF